MHLQLFFLAHKKEFWRQQKIDIESHLRINVIFSDSLTLPSEVTSNLHVLCSLIEYFTRTTKIVGIFMFIKYDYEYDSFLVKTAISIGLLILFYMIIFLLFWILALSRQPIIHSLYYIDCAC